MPQSFRLENIGLINRNKKLSFKKTWGVKRIYTLREGN